MDEATKEFVTYWKETKFNDLSNEKIEYHFKKMNIQKEIPKDIKNSNTGILFFEDVLSEKGCILSDKKRIHLYCDSMHCSKNCPTKLISLLNIDPEIVRNILINETNPKYRNCKYTKTISYQTTNSKINEQLKNEKIKSFNTEHDEIQSFTKNSISATVSINNKIKNCTIHNRTIEGFLIPKEMLNNELNKGHIETSGVYFLINNKKQDVYIGESENVLNRLIQHKNKDFDEIAVIINKSESLNKAQIKYLEYKLIENAKYINRYKVTNTNFPSEPKLSKNDTNTINEFFLHIITTMDFLGIKIFNKI